jgi:hypothetical protein
MTLTSEQLGKALLDYCADFNVPPEHIIEILNDQKVVPMIRGKATEYNAALALQDILPYGEWTVTKLNLNAQPNTHDEDISITHRRSRVTLRVESKNAVRGSMTSGDRCRICKEPHFCVKCHRSRSNIKLAARSNDRYKADCFDIIVCNVSNALFQGNTLGATLELLDDKAVIKIAKAYYGTKDDKDLIKAAFADWRYAFAEQIAVDGYIPRTPLVKLRNDPHWKNFGTLATDLLELVKLKVKSRR